MLQRIKRSLKNRALELLKGQSAIELPPIEADELALITARFERPKFFVLGYPRSGTTLLARLLRQSPEVSCRWQAHFASGPGDWLDRMAQPALKDWLTLGSNRWVEEGQPSLTALARVSADYVMERVADSEGSEWVGDKTPTPRMDWAIERLRRLYPDAYVIAIVRDGRDAALSQRIQAFIDQPETLSPLDARLRRAIERAPERFGADGKSIFSSDWLERVAANWAVSVGAGHRQAQDQYGARYHSLRYEDLLAEPIVTMKEAFDFLGVRVDQGLERSLMEAMQRNPAADWHRQAAPALNQHLSRGQAGGWQSWFTEPDRELFHSKAGPQLKLWGYLSTD